MMSYGMSICWLWRPENSCAEHTPEDCWKWFSGSLLQMGSKMTKVLEHNEILWERVTCILEKDGGIKHRFMNMYKHTIRRLSVELLLNNLPAPVPLTLGYHSNHSSHMQSLFSFISCELMSYIPYLLLANFQLYMSNSTNVRAKFTLFMKRPSYI